MLHGIFRARKGTYIRRVFCHLYNLAVINPLPKDKPSPNTLPTTLDLSFTMRCSTLFAAALPVFAFASASPIFSRQENVTTSSNSTRSNFYLVASSQSTPSSNSSALQNATLTTLFSPYYQPNYLLRLIEPGYGFVPTFNISDGVLHCEESGPHGIGEYIFNSTEIHSGSELQFRAQVEGHGDLSLANGYLLAVNGSSVGWTICVEELGQRVVCE